eukprot:SAG31_NODE_10152_length_1177_cov_1.705937_1_plen_222_part_01
MVDAAHAEWSTQQKECLRKSSWKRRHLRLVDTPSVSELQRSRRSFFAGQTRAVESVRSQSASIALEARQIHYEWDFIGTVAPSPYRANGDPRQRGLLSRTGSPLRGGRTSSSMGLAGTDYRRLRQDAGERAASKHAGVRLQAESALNSRSDILRVNRRRQTAPADLQTAASLRKELRKTRAQTVPGGGRGHLADSSSRFTSRWEQIKQTQAKIADLKATVTE